MSRDGGQFTSETLAQYDGLIFLMNTGEDGTSIPLI
jgi:hypothetical protein